MRFLQNRFWCHFIADSVQLRDQQYSLDERRNLIRDFSVKSLIELVLDSKPLSECSGAFYVTDECEMMRVLST